MSFDGKGKARLDNHVAVFCEGAWTHSRSVASKTVSVEYRNRWPGAMLGGMNLVAEEWAERFHSAGTPTQENRWSTESVSLWRNAQADAIMDELNSIIPEDRAMELQVEFVKLYTRDLPYMPLYYTPEILVIKNGLTGVTPRIESGGQNMNTWNLHVWNKT